MMRWTNRMIGAKYSNKTCEFTVWAPFHDEVSLILTEENETLQMKKQKTGYWTTKVEGIKPGTKYKYKLPKKTVKPDPASNWQPNGVFGDSAVVNHEAYRWKDDEWKNISFPDLVFYELHVGTFTEAGTFKAIEDRAKEIVETGINAIELMPVTQFSGSRNWGYDSVFPYAVHNTYGTPDNLRHLVDYCHFNGTAVFLDIIYNHIGPEGSCLQDFGPYFLKNRRTLWGSSINFDGPQCSEVRKYFFENALYWFRNYHIDGLRLDAVHSIIDRSPKHFLKELAENVSRYSTRNDRKSYLVAEANLNNPVIVRSRRKGGYGLDAQWLDDFHHILHVLLTGEKSSYYADFGGISDLVKSLREGYVYTGQFSQFRQANHGQPATGITPDKFIVFSQNHDHIGNRAFGERLVTLARLEAAKLAAAIVVLSPFIPLFFMGEEYGEDAPFLYFTNFSDQALAENVRKGRREEHKTNDSQGEIPDPQNQDTFEKSRINWRKRREDRGKKILEYYKTLLHLRKSLAPNLGQVVLPKFSTLSQGHILIMTFGKDKSAVAVANFSNQQCSVDFRYGGAFVKAIDSADDAWAGPGSLLPNKVRDKSELILQPRSVAVYIKPKLVKELD